MSTMVLSEMPGTVLTEPNPGALNRNSVAVTEVNGRRIYDVSIAFEDFSLQVRGDAARVNEIVATLDFLGLPRHIMAAIVRMLRAAGVMNPEYGLL